MYFFGFCNKYFLVLVDTIFDEKEDLKKAGIEFSSLCPKSCDLILVLASCGLLKSPSLFSSNGVNFDNEQDWSTGSGSYPERILSSQCGILVDPAWSQIF